MKKGTKKASAAKKAKGNPAGIAGLAFKHGFYLETSWILSLIFEKKAKNLLKQIERAAHVKGYTFEQSIKRIKYHHLGGRITELEMNLDLGLIDAMRNWKNTRNTMLKDMITMHVSHQRMERLASEGITMYKKWNKSLKSVKREMKHSAKQANQKAYSELDEEKK
jgi:hypothetical protein